MPVVGPPEEKSPRESYTSSEAGVSSSPTSLSQVPPTHPGHNSSSLVCPSFFIPKFIIIFNIDHASCCEGEGTCRERCNEGRKAGRESGFELELEFKAESSSATASGTATPTTTAASESLKGASAGGSGKLEKPDKKKYDEELTALKAEIDAKQALRVGLLLLLLLYRSPPRAHVE